MKIKRILLHNMGLKSLALFLAFVTWFYIEGATKTDSEKTVLQRIFSSSYHICKELRVKPIFMGEVPEGHEFLKNAVKVTPESIVVIGPSKILSKKEYIFTKPIDLAEYTKEKTVTAKLKSISPAIRLEDAEVQVYIPVKKIESTD